MTVQTICGGADHINHHRERSGIQDMKRIKLKCTRAHLCLALLMLVYTLTAFVNLGALEVPVTQPQMTADADGGHKSYITYVMLEEEVPLTSMLLYKGLGTAGVTVYTSDDGGEHWTEAAQQVCRQLYAWETVPLSCTAQLLCISIGGDDALEVFEAGFLSGQTVIDVTAGEDALFDEQAFVPMMPTYENGMYFDETYHARTAYEHLLGMEPYEISHPPLGKLLIACGIALFGMSPFGWRFAGCLFGILMLPVLYVLAKRLFGRDLWALTAAALLAFDFLHFTQTRTALIDAFAVFFILLAYTLMYRYYTETPAELPYRSSLILLACCGCVLGLGIAVKWTAVYAACGLAVLFVQGAVRRYRAGERVLPTCLWCVLFFGIVPFGIYFLSYLPYFTADTQTPAWKIFFDNQIYMLTYHGGFSEPHPFQSKWYTWPLVYRPIWYYGAKSLAAEGLVSSICALGNPLVWWCGALCIPVSLYRCVRSREDRFLLTAMLSQYLPWAFISRPTFIYHFFASVPFLILMLVSALKALSERMRYGYVLTVVLLVGAAGLFVMFYPVLSGAVVDRGYVLNVLSWFDSWILCY